MAVTADLASEPFTLRCAPVQERSRARLDLILDAAHALLDVHAFDDVTTSQIAAQAGVSVGAVYKFFRDRNAVYVALIGRALDRIAECYRSFEGRRFPSLAALIDALIDALGPIWREHRSLIGLYQSYQRDPVVCRKGEEMDAAAIACLLGHVRAATDLGEADAHALAKVIHAKVVFLLDAREDGFSWMDEAFVSAWRATIDALVARP